MSVRPVYRPPAKGEGQEAGTLVLRDGSQLGLWRALGEDAERIAGFVERLPAEDRHEVLRSLRLEASELQPFLERLAGSERGEALFAQGPEGGGAPVVAFGAYRELADEPAAAIALAVAPELRRTGVATLLLERLSLLAAQHGVSRFVGVAGADNAPLVALFRQGGFETEQRREGDFLNFVVPTQGGAGREGVVSRVFAAASLRPLFFPRSIAVVGASREPDSVGHSILTSLVGAGFEGPVYPVNPKADYVCSIRAYPSVEAIGAPIDLGIVAVPARVAAAVVDSCAAAGARAIILISAGFAETGDGRRRRSSASCSSGCATTACAWSAPTAWG